MDRRRDRRLYPVLVVSFIGTLGFSIVLLFLVFLVERFGGNAIAYGFVGATYPAFQLIGAPLLGRWSDRYGRKRILLLSQGGTLLSWVVFASALYLSIDELGRFGSGDSQLVLTVPLLVVFVARALDGLTGGNVSVANAYLADITPDDERSKNFGKMGIASNLGFVLGPTLASVLGATAWGERLPVFAALAISLIATLLIAFYLPESMPLPRADLTGPKSVQKVFGQEHRECERLHPTARRSLGEVLRLEDVPPMLVLYFVVFLAFNLFYTSFPVHAARTLGWTVTETGIFFAVLSLSMVFSQGPVLSFVSKRLSEPTLIVTGNVLLAANFLLLVSSDLRLIYLAAALFALGNGIMWPSVLSILSKIAGKEHQGAVQGMAGSVGSLASIVGLVAGGYLYGAAGTWAFVGAAALILFAALLSLPLFAIARRLEGDPDEMPAPL